MPTQLKRLLQIIFGDQLTETMLQEFDDAWRKGINPSLDGILSTAWPAVLSETMLAFPQDAKIPVSVFLASLSPIFLANTALALFDAYTKGQYKKVHAIVQGIRAVTPTAVSYIMTLRMIGWIIILRCGDMTQQQCEQSPEGQITRPETLSFIATAALINLLLVFPPHTGATGWLVNRLRQTDLNSALKNLTLASLHTYSLGGQAIKNAAVLSGVYIGIENALRLFIQGMPSPASFDLKLAYYGAPLATAFVTGSLAAIPMSTLVSEATKAAWRKPMKLAAAGSMSLLFLTTLYLLNLEREFPIQADELLGGTGQYFSAADLLNFLLCAAIPLALFSSVRTVSALRSKPEADLLPLDDQFEYQQLTEPSNDGSDNSDDADKKESQANSLSCWATLSGASHRTEKQRQQEMQDRPYRPSIGFGG